MIPGKILGRSVNPERRARLFANTGAAAPRKDIHSKSRFWATNGATGVILADHLKRIDWKARVEDRQLS